MPGICLLDGNSIGNKAILLEPVMCMNISTVLELIVVTGIRPLHRLFFDSGFP
jgi:hypothetical protein